ncbi:MAG: FapA family protein [Desulfobacteraceae bacterium]
MDQITGNIVVACNTCKSYFKVSKNLLGKQVTCSKCKRVFTVSEAAPKTPPSVEDEFFLCKLALNYGLMKEDNLQAAFQEYSRQNQSHGKASIERLLISHGGLSEDHLLLLKVIRENWDLRLAEKRFATEAVARKYISEAQARKILAEQAQFFYKTRKIKLLMDFLTESGAMSQEQCRTILSSTGPKQQLWKSRLEESKVVTPPIEQRPEPTIPKASRSHENESLKKDIIEPLIQSKSPERMAPLFETKPSPVKPVVSKSEPVHPEPSVMNKGEAPSDKEQAKSDDILLKTEKLQQEPADEETLPSHLDTQSTEIVSILQETEAAVDEQTLSAESIEPVISEEISEDTISQDDISLGTGSTTLSINGLELIISTDGLIAMIKIPKDMDTSDISVDDIKTSLREEDIVYGIVDDALIRGFLNSKIFREKPFKIAEGKVPVKGRDGNITYFFDTDYLKVGEVSESGSIDFKNRGEIPYVTEGTILAEITSAVPGKNGKDIFGRDLLVQEVKQVFLKCENGTALSDDGRKATATANGQPKLSFGNRLHVLSEIVIPGDVSFETGHVDFEGNVIIRGGVQNDFHVKGANVTAEEVFAAHIIAKGDLIVKNGITGATLDVEGNIKAKFINKSTIRAYGNVVAEKEIIDCNIQTSSACAVSYGKIVSSHISAKLGIEAQDIGTEISKPCHLKIGVDDHINHEIDLIDKKINEEQDILNNLELKMKNLDIQDKALRKTISVLAHVQDRSQLEIKDLAKHLEQIKTQGDQDKIKAVELRMEILKKTAKEADADINANFDTQDNIDSEVKQLREKIWACKEQIMGLNRQKKDKIDWADKITTKAYIKTKGPIFSETFIVGKHCSRTLRETMRAVRIHEAMSLDAPEGWEIKLT